MVLNEVEASPLFGVAMLKIAMELKKVDGAPVRGGSGTYRRSAGSKT